MSTIRRQSIISSIVVYIGFGIGLLNIYLFTKQGVFTDTQFGLYNAFIAIATMMMAFSNLGIPAYIYKFYPYYSDHLPPNKNDMATWSLLVGTVGYLFVVIAGVVFKGLVIRKYVEHSPEVVTYYNWIFVLGFGLLIYTIMEAFAWQLHKSVLTNFLREVQWRLFTTIIIVLFLFRVIRSYDLFIKLFAFTYPGIAAILFIYLVVTKKIHFTWQVSKVTRRFLGKILKLCSFIYVGALIVTVSQVFDSLVIGAVLKDALGKLAVYSVAANIASMIQAPQRGIIAASIAHLSKAWKDKKMETIQRIYKRSSINQLVFSCGFYVLIVINFIDAVHSFHLKDSYLNGFYVFLFLGATKIVDMGTGVNAQIIGTSTYWRFELMSGIILLLLMLPLNYLLTKHFDIVGTAVANLASITIYNAIRIVFLWKKFRLFPFTRQSVTTVLLGAACFLVCFFAFRNLHGLAGLVTRSAALALLYGTGVLYLKLTPDIIPVWKSIRKRIGIRD